MASARIRADRSGRLVRAASSATGSGPPASAANRPDELAVNNCLAAMNPVAIRTIGVGSTVIDSP
jgi:hypothetical protein